VQFNEGQSQFPVGKRRELEASKETLPVLEVANKVQYVNPEIESPFQLEEGKPTNLGLFLNSQLQAGEDSRRLEAENYHRRSLLLARIIFGEKYQKGIQRQLFRDVVIKGSGQIKEGSDVAFSPPQAEEVLRGEGKRSWGIMSLKSAIHDMEISEKFHNLGMRVSRVIAIVELEEIVFEGEKISIDEAKKRGIIDDTVTPVLEIRGFGTHNRLLDVQDQGNSPEKKRIIIEDARLLVAQELGEDPAAFDLYKYATWLAKTLGNNMGLMGKSGYRHGNLSQGHNITLDGCLVDFETVEKTDDANAIMEDRAHANAGLLMFLMSIFDSPVNSLQIQEILKEYEKAYDKAKET